MVIRKGVKENICRKNPMMRKGKSEEKKKEKEKENLDSERWWIKITSELEKTSQKGKNQQNSYWYCDHVHQKSFWTRVGLPFGIRTPASATSFKAFTSILPKSGLSFGTSKMGTYLETTGTVTRMIDLVSFTQRVWSCVHKWYPFRSIYLTQN